MSLEETVLFTIAMAFPVNIYAFMTLKLFMDWIDWKIECKNFLSKADDECCMCGSLIDNHGYGDNHAAVSQLDWALDNKPKLQFGEW